jgi:two-component system phosphate regulon sensor histidine kinase PhoR
MRFGRHMLLAALFVLVPLVALVVVGILVLVFQRATLDITFGVLILSFCLTLLIGAILLVVSLRRATKLSQLQLDLVSKVSHEFKTPLTSIRMFAETLSEHQKLSDQQRGECLSMLRRETERLGAIIDRWLEFGRMEAGKMVYHRVPESVGSVVELALRAFEPVRAREGVELTTDVASDLPMVVVDRELISQALVNLLHNAAKYGGDSKWVRLRCWREDGRVALSVQDKGPGIPRRERRRIFDRFYRIDDRLNRRQEGSGLGLAIVRHVVQAHGGTVRVRNHPGGGAEFSILLPTA